jgi:DNA (cytosine-5)-methyltransferase 1
LIEINQVIPLVPGHSAFPIHPWLNRQLTVREAARIQTFPDDIEFIGSHGQQCKQVGNAFPPIAAEYLANNIEKAILNDWKDDNTSNLAYYSLVDR